MIFVLVPTDFKLKFWTVFGVEISKFLSFATRHTSNFDLKKENGHQNFSYDSPLSYGALCLWADLTLQCIGGFFVQFSNITPLSLLLSKMDNPYLYDIGL